VCGIVGCINLGSVYPIQKLIIKRMTNILHYRGPDDSGCFFEMEDGRIEEDNDNIDKNDGAKIPIKVALGHRLLSVVDSSILGHQPMPNKQKTAWIVLDGEIYNYKDLKEETEIYEFNLYPRAIISIYEKYGEAFVEKLDGMFALALWDRKHEKLILARDPIGKKPLYYAEINKCFIFASELKSLLLHPLIQKNIDTHSLRKYLFYGYIPAPHSIFSSVKKLSAGHFLVFDKNGVKIKEYWRPKFSSVKISENEAISNFKSLLLKAITKRLISNVPIGVFLSGGIDSSIISFFASKLVPGIKTFSIGFTVKEYDELKFARKVAKLIGSDHYDEILSPDKMLEVIPKLPDILDEPMADISIVPTYFLSWITKKRVTVALGGDGGDELFAGYPTYFGHRVFEYYEKIPSFFRKKIAKIVDLLPTKLGYYTFDYKAKRFITGDNFLPWIRHYIWSSCFQHNEIDELLIDRSKINLFEDIEIYLEKCNSLDLIEKMLFLDMKLSAPEAALVKVDRASMAHSLEVREPFLDKALMEFINSLPIRYKLHGITGKYLLKRAMKGILSNEILHRKKQGFSVPISKWIRKELKCLINERLCKSEVEKDGIFNYNFIEKIKDEHFSLKKDNWKSIWTLLIFQQWYKKYYS